MLDHSTECSGPGQCMYKSAKESREQMREESGYSAQKQAAQERKKAKKLRVLGENAVDIRVMKASTKFILQCSFVKMLPNKSNSSVTSVTIFINYWRCKIGIIPMIEVVLCDILVQYTRDPGQVCGAMVKSLHDLILYWGACFESQLSHFQLSLL